MKLEDSTMNKRNHSNRLSRYKMMRRKKWQMHYRWAALLLSLAIFLFAGTFLVLDEEPKKVDAIIILSGGSERLDKAMMLYQKGYADHLILSNGLETNLEEKARKHLPSSSIIMEDKARSTLDNAIYTKEIMIHHHFRSAIVVSSDYHMKRVKYLFEKAYEETNVELTYISSKSGFFKPLLWWTSKSSIRVTVNEYLKLAGNALGWHGPKAKAPLNALNHLLF
ncbi:YdcF family protein [Ammoniphilus sp. 3BR4]|uniref:YdcF family protein n=1 Tax=Ammoniphilus sp. 3BR4 TaxID=3158265 RepID=UPI003465E88A